MAEPDKKIELELAVRDSVSTTLKIIAANLESVNSKMSRGGNAIQESVEVLQKVGGHTAGVGENAKQTTKSLLGVADTLKTIVGIVSTGPVGLALATAAAIGFVGNQMGKLATRRLELKRLSQDTGLSEGKISILQRYGKRMGFDPEVTHKNIVQAATAIKEMFTAGAGSQLFRNLADIGEAKFGAELLKEVQSGGSIDKAFDKAADRYDELFKQDPAKAAQFAQGLGVSESFLRDIKANAAGLVPAYEMSAEAAEAWAKRMSVVHESYNALWAGTMGFFIRTLILGDRRAAAKARNISARTEHISRTLPTRSSASRWGSSRSRASSLSSSRPAKKIPPPSWARSPARLSGSREGQSVRAGRKAARSGMPGNRYLVGEWARNISSGGSSGVVGAGGPQLFRPNESGRIISNEQIVAGARKAWAMGEEKAREYQPKGVEQSIEGAALSRLAPKGLSYALQWLKKEGAKGAASETRAWLRQKLAIADPQEDSPWAPGGAWDKHTQVAANDLRCTIDGAQQSAEGTQLRLIGGVNFTNVPPGVSTKAESDGFDKFQMARTQPILS